MAEGNGDNKKSSGIGELFVEFGVKGFGTMLKSLNAVSASFLLVKNAGQQFAQMLTKPIKESGNAAVEIGKMSSALGITMKEAMKLQLYFKQHNLSEGLLGDLTSISDMLTKVQLGIGGISGEFAYAMHRMGLDWTKYDGSMESMIRLTNDVKKATADMDANTRRVMMKAVGLQPEWSYAFERGDFNLADYKTISDEQVENLIKSQEAMNKMTAEVDQLKMHLMSKLTPAVVKISDWIGDRAGEGAQGKYDKPVSDAVNGIIKRPWLSFSPAGAIAAATLGYYEGKNQESTAKNKKQGQVTGQAANITPELLSSVQLIEPPTDLTPVSKGYKDTLPQINGNPTGGAAPIQNPAPDFMTTPEALAPSNISSIMQTNNINITNQNTINGANSESIGGRITSLSADSYNQALSQYQVNNRAGL